MRNCPMWGGSASGKGEQKEERVEVATWPVQRRVDFILTQWGGREFRWGPDMVRFVFRNKHDQRPAATEDS